MTFLDVADGVRLHVQDVGQGPAVLLLAGFGLNHEVWDGQIRALCPSRRVLALDLRGTGESSKPADGYDMSTLASDVRAVLAELDLRDVTVVGHSFGAQVGLALAAASADRVGRLVLVGSHGVRASRSAEFPFGRDAGRTLEALVTAERERRPAARRANITGAFLREPDPDLVDWLVRCQLRMPSWSAVACYQTYLTTDLSTELSGLRIPVGQILGEKDPVTSVDAAPWVRERVPEVRQVVLDDCGHYPMFEAADRFEGVLAELVDGG